MKIFISHSSKDKDYGDALVDLLRGIDIKHAQITYTSRVPTGIPFGKNIFDWLKEELKEKPHVLFLLSPDYYASIACQNEMGASWVLGNKQTMFFTPELDLNCYDFRNGALNPRDIGINLDDKDRIFEFVEYLETEFQLKKKGSYLNREVDKFLAAITKIKKDRLEIQKKQEETANSSLPATVTPQKEVLSEDDKLFNTILEDIAKNHESLYEQPNFDAYTKAKFLENVDSDTEVKWFKKLWPLVFKNEASNSDPHKLMNFKFLNFLFNANKQECSALIRADKKYFNDVSNEKSCVSQLIKFLANNESLYPDIGDIVRIYIEVQVKDYMDDKICAWFLSENYPKHLEMLKNELRINSFDVINLLSYHFIIDLGLERNYIREVSNFIGFWISDLIDHRNFQICFDAIFIPYLHLIEETDLRDFCKLFGGYAYENFKRYDKSNFSRLEIYIEKKYPDSDMLSFFTQHR